MVGVARISRTAAIAGALATHAACLYVAPINERPRARIDEVTVGPYHVGDQVIATVSGSSDDGASRDLSVIWQAQMCDQQGSCEVVDVGTSGGSIRTDAAVVVDRKGELIISAEIADGQGATDAIELRVDVVNQAPTIEVQVANGFPDPGDSGGYVIGLPLELVGNIADPDGDELTTTWVAFPPMGSLSTVDVVPVDGEDESYTLEADDPGIWEVKITADDGDGGVVEHIEQVAIAVDGPPCIGVTQPLAGPIAALVSEPTRFTVQAVFDALDGYPKPFDAHPAVGETEFRWQLASPASGGSFVALTNPVADVLIDPSNYAPGDRLTLRVEVDDRNNFLPLGCDVNQALCNALDTADPTPACTQRTTWEIEVR